MTEEQKQELDGPSVDCIVNFAWGLPERPGIAMTWAALATGNPPCVHITRMENSD